MNLTVKNYMSEQLSQLTDEVGANAASITVTQSIQDEMKEAMPDNLKTRIAAIEELVADFDEKVSFI